MKFISWNVMVFVHVPEKDLWIFSGDGRRHFLHSGDEDAGRTA